MEYDAKTKQFIENAVPAQIVRYNGSIEGIIIDTKLFESITFLLIVHSIGGEGDHTLSLEDGDDSVLSDAAPVLVVDDPKTLVGTFKTLNAQDILLFTALQINRVGYIGKKRFVRASIDTANASSLTGISGVIAVLANAKNGPTVDQ